MAKFLRRDGKLIINDGKFQRVPGSAANCECCYHCGGIIYPGWIKLDLSGFDDCWPIPPEYIEIGGWELEPFPEELLGNVFYPTMANGKSIVINRKKAKTQSHYIPVISGTSYYANNNDQYHYARVGFSDGGFNEIEITASYNCLAINHNANPWKDEAPCYNISASALIFYGDVVLAAATSEWYKAIPYGDKWKVASGAIILTHDKGFCDEADDVPFPGVIGRKGTQINSIGTITATPYNY